MLCHSRVAPGVVCLAILLFLGAPGFALARSPGWFVEGEVGNVDASGVISDFTFDNDDTGWSFGFGYSFNEYFSLQAGYSDMGSYLGTDCPPPLLCLVTNFEDIDLTGWSAAATASWPLGNNFELFGTVGAMYWDADFSTFNHLNDSSTDLLYGVGAAWWPSEHWRLSLSYEAVDFADLESILAGLRYQF